MSRIRSAPTPDCPFTVCTWVDTGERARLRYVRLIGDRGENDPDTQRCHLDRSTWLTFCVHRGFGSLFLPLILIPILYYSLRTHSPSASSRNSLKSNMSAFVGRSAIMGPSGKLFRCVPRFLLRWRPNKTKRSSLFPVGSSEPVISRSAINTLRNCRACFWLIPAVCAASKSLAC